MNTISLRLAGALVLVLSSLSLSGCDSSNVDAVTGEPDLPLPTSQGIATFNMDWDASAIRTFKMLDNPTNLTLNTSRLTIDFDARTFAIEMAGVYEDGSGPDTLRLPGTFDPEGGLARFSFADGPTYDAAFFGAPGDTRSIVIDLNEFATQYDEVGSAYGNLGTMYFDRTDATPSREFVGSGALDITYVGSGLPRDVRTCGRDGCFVTLASAEVTLRPDGTARFETVHYPQGQPDQAVVSEGSARYAATTRRIAMTGTDSRVIFGPPLNGPTIRDGFALRGIPATGLTSPGLQQEYVAKQ